MTKEYIVSFVILTRNRKNELKEALESVITQDYSGKEIIVVDNHSSDGSPQMVKEYFPQVRLVELERNTGVCGGRNIGIRNSRGEIIIFLDDDALFASPNATFKIVEKFASSNQIGVLAFRVKDYYTGEIPRQNIPRSDKKIMSSEYEASYFCGTCAIRKSLLDDVGLFSEDFFYSGEELDLAFRILETDLKIIYCPQIEVYHKASSVERPGWQRFYYFHRNRIWLSFKYLPLSYAFIHSTVWCAKIFVESLIAGYLTFFLKGMRDGIIKLPALMKRERKVISRQTRKKLKSLSGRLYY